MFDQRKAAEYLVAGWCMDWSMYEFLATMSEGAAKPRMPIEAFMALIEAAREVLPCLPDQAAAYTKHSPVRQFVGGAYPKLSAWLFSRATDSQRLACAAQVARLTYRGCTRPAVSDVDRAQMRSSGRDMDRAGDCHRISRDAFKTHQRSAWNVCKG